MSKQTIEPKFLTKEEFKEKCRLASTCELDAPEHIANSDMVEFIVLLLREFQAWSSELQMSHEILSSVQYLLRSGTVRDELANVLFNRGVPTNSQVETTLRLLFLVASTRHSLVTHKRTKSALSAWSSRL